FELIDLPYTWVSGLRGGPGFVVFAAGSETEPAAFVKLTLATRRIDVLRRSTELALDPGYVSPAEAIEFPTTQDRTAHAFYYAPTTRDFPAPAGDLPPLIVKSHGGPTSATTSVLALGIQYWTSRGFAVVDVNYGGSTGYGRAYRERLKGQWGI